MIAEMVGEMIFWYFFPLEPNLTQTKTKKFVVWSTEDAPCSKFSCVDVNCAHGFAKNEKKFMGLC